MTACQAAFAFDEHPSRAGAQPHFGVVYVLTAPDGREYVGKTKRTLKERWCQHRSAAKAGKPGALYDAIREHGPAVFTRRVAYRARSERELYAAERHWISHLGTETSSGMNAIGGAYHVRRPAKPHWFDASSRRVERFGIEFRAAPGSYAPKQGPLYFSAAGCRLDGATRY